MTITLQRTGAIRIVADGPVRARKFRAGPLDPPDRTAGGEFSPFPPAGDDLEIEAPAEARI